jgi:site-specific DNA-methyltransferase (adenine-specific)
MSNTFWTTTAASSATDQWATPSSYFQGLAGEFSFTLDVCALASSAKAPTYYGPDHTDATKQDGLAQDWATDAAGGHVWMNPPYGKTIGDWMRKAAAESDKGATVVCLVPARTDTAWFQDTALARQAQGRAEIRFIRGRLKFGTAKDAAPFPNALVIFRP